LLYDSIHDFFPFGYWGRAFSLLSLSACWLFSARTGV